ncbi:hypothetical protein B484DRAFT_472973, partial [Ochromonadaceae sp. CCMP2298]
SSCVESSSFYTRTTTCSEWLTVPSALKKTGGTWVMLPAATRRKPHNQLWKDYSTHCASAGTERVSKAHFYMAVNTSTKGQDKPLAALSVQKIKGTKTFLMIEELIALLCPGASQPLARAALFELTATTQAFLHDDFRAHLAHDAETNAELPLPCHCGQHSLRFALSGDEDMGYGIPADETAFTQHCSDCGRVELLLQSLAHLIDIAGDAEAVQLGGETKSSLHRFLKRIESRLRAYVSHLVRFEQECGIMQAEINALEPGFAIAIFDFKKKWMSMYYRESQVDFYAKGGKAWGGLAVVRKVLNPGGVADATTGLLYKLETHIIDAVSNDGCEDYVSCTASIQIGLSKIKVQFPEVKGIKLFLDGAGALAGIATLRELSIFGTRIDLPIFAVFVCVSGDGKTALDGHFAYAMMVVWINVVAGRGRGDIVDAASLVTALSKNGGITGSQALQIRFQRDLMPTTKMMEKDKVKDISAMCHREFEYDAAGVLTQITLRRHSYLGSGYTLSRAELFGTLASKWPAAGAMPEVVAANDPSAAVQEHQHTSSGSKSASSTDITASSSSS